MSKLRLKTARRFHVERRPCDWDAKPSTTTDFGGILIETARRTCARCGRCEERSAITMPYGGGFGGWGEWSIAR